MDFSAHMSASAAWFGLELSAGQQEAFVKYFDLLIEWNNNINLTAITEPSEVAVKHMIDSLTCLDERVFSPGCSVIDVGTGAGFPGIPLKIMRPDIKLTLLDSLNKRIKYLQAVISDLKLTEVAVIHGRAEDAARDINMRDKFDVAVSRAVARLNVLCELCLPFVAPGGYFIALKGSQASEELAEAARAISILGAKVEKVLPMKLPGLEDSRSVIYIRKIAATPKSYPRQAGTPEKKPL